MVEKDELRVRAMTLHRRRWLQQGEMRDWASRSPLTIGPVTIDRLGGQWTVALRLDDDDAYHLISLEAIERGTDKTPLYLIEAALNPLRAAMVLDDLAEI